MSKEVMSECLIEASILLRVADDEEVTDAIMGNIATIAVALYQERMRGMKPMYNPFDTAGVFSHQGRAMLGGDAT